MEQEEALNLLRKWMNNPQITAEELERLRADEDGDLDSYEQIAKEAKDYTYFIKKTKEEYLDEYATMIIEGNKRFGEHMEKEDGTDEEYGFACWLDIDFALLCAGDYYDRVREQYQHLYREPNKD